MAAYFPQDKQVLGHYLGPSVDIGPSMTCKIPKSNGYVIHTSTYRSLTPVEQTSPEEVKLRDDFDARVNEILCLATTLAELEHMGAKKITHDIYEDADDGRFEPSDNNDISDPVDKSITPEPLDGYISTDRTISWECLSDLKESYPIEVAEYAVAQHIDHKLAFVWWVPFTLQKRNWIISAVKYRKHQKQQFKYGLNILKELAYVYAIDKDNGNT